MGTRNYWAQRPPLASHGALTVSSAYGSYRGGDDGRRLQGPEMKPVSQAPGRPPGLQCRRARAGAGPHPEPGPCCQPGRRVGQRGGRRGRGLREKQLSALGQAGHGSQAPRSVLSRERLWVLRGDAGLGGLLRLELLDAVECLGESESSPS